MKKKNKIPKSFIHKIIENFLKNNNSRLLKTRFPPDPNGYLHIGHAKSICLNFELAKLYNGSCNLRFDDTNPNINHTKYIHAIKKDILWLGFKWNKNIRYTSMYFDQIYQYAIELIKKKLAYVDQLQKHEIKKYRGTLKTPGINSPYRNQTIEENIFLFEKMKSGKIPEGKACLRAKIDMSSPFIVMRDPVLYRIKYLKHHITKKKWCIYPTYDFAHCISDSLEKITHSLCTLEFQDNKQLYNWILNNISVTNYPKQYEYSRLNMEYCILSKRKLNLLIENNIIKEWDDPRMPTIRGLRRKGYTPTAIKTFCQKIGITKQNNLIENSILESCLRKELDKNSHRTMGIINPIKLNIYNLPKNYEENIKIPNHPKNTSFGSRNILFTNTIYIDKSDFQQYPKKNYNRLYLGGTVKLKYSYTITAKYIKKDKKKNIIEIFCICHFKKNANTKKYGIIHWLSKKQAIKSKFQLFKYLFNIKNPDHEKDTLSHINNTSKSIKYGFIHYDIMKNKKITTYQFERIGYFHIDQKLSKQNKIVLNESVSLKKYNYKI